jgi:hypothetical protein
MTHAKFAKKTITTNTTALPRWWLTTTFVELHQNQVGSYDAVTQPGTENSKLVNNLWTGPTHLEPGAWKTAMAEASLLFRDCARHTTQHSTANVWMDHTPWRALDDDVGKLLLDRWAALGIHNWNSVPLGAGRRRRFN